MTAWLRGLWLLRSASLVRDLGERKLHLDALEEIERGSPGLILDPDVRLICYSPGLFLAEDGVRVRGGTVLAFGDPMNGFGRIVVGEGTWIGEYNNLRASGGADIKIGRGCLISQFCTLVGTNHSIQRGQPIQSQGPDTSSCGVCLGDDVWLGAGVTVTPGVSVGRGAVLGAGAVVTRDVPAYEVWGGIPARKLAERR